MPRVRPLEIFKAIMALFYVIGVRNQSLNYFDIMKVKSTKF
jgi:hypothetical protein